MMMRMRMTQPAREVSVLTVVLVYLLFATGESNGQCPTTTMYPPRGEQAAKIGFAAYEQVYCNLMINLTQEQLLKLSACEDLIAGRHVAAVKRICLRSRTKNFENDPITLRIMWCSDPKYKESVQKCIQFKLQTMPGAPGYMREQGTIASRFRALACFNKTLTFTFTVP